MSNIFYGIKRLVLLNTSSYSLGDFPLDRPLSISAANNRGKSTAINALQFPFLCNMNDMSFPRSNEDTRKYYFPYENSYVLVEVVTEAGVYVVGAAGKGEASGFEYQLFAYKASLELEDFTIEADGDQQEIRNLKELQKHLATKNMWLRQLAPKQMRDALMGKTITLNHGEKFSIGIFRLKNMTDANYRLFIRVFKNLLHMNTVNIDEIKRLLIQILPHTQEDSSIDIMQRYKIVYEEVDQAKNKVDTALNIAKDVKNLVAAKQEADEQCGILRALFPNISSRFESERNKREAEIEWLESERKQVAPSLEEKKKEEGPLRAENQRLAIAKDKIDQRLKDLAENDAKYALFQGLEVLEEQIRKDERRLHTIIGELERANLADKKAIMANLKDAKIELDKISRRLSAIDSNILFMLNSEFGEGSLERLSKLLNADLLTSIPFDGDNASVLDEEMLFDRVREILNRCKGEIYDDGAIRVDFSSIKPVDLEDYLDFENTKARQERLANAVKGFERDLEVASDFENWQKERSEIEKKLADDRRVIEEYKNYLDEKNKEDEIKALLKDATDALSESDKKQSKLQEVIVELSNKERALAIDINAKRTSLEKTIENLKKVKPLDADDGFGSQPKHRLPTSLDDMIDTYILSFEKHEQAKKDITLSHKIIETSGGLRFTSGGELDTTISELQQAIEGLDEFKKDVDAKERAAGQEIGALLKSLRNRFEEFSTEITGFNRKMNRLKISNLKKINFVIDQDNEVLHLIRTLVDQDTIFSDAESVHQSVKRLDDMVRQRNIKLSLENLFNLGISVELENKKAVSSFGDSNIESTGTGLTVNVIMNVMLLNELLHTKKGQITNIPIYVDEAERIDPSNQETLIEQCLNAGFVPVFASVHGQATADYWIGLEEVDGRVFVDRSKWYKLEKIDNHTAEAASA